MLIIKSRSELFHRALLNRKSRLTGVFINVIYY